jgi:amidase
MTTLDTLERNTSRLERSGRFPGKTSTSIIPPVGNLNGWPVAEIAIQELQSHFSEGHFTSVDYVEFCQDYIKTTNPYLNAVIETNLEALKIAEQLDDERRSGSPRSALHGVPILVKDNIATNDSMQTTAGSLALLGSKVPKDAFVVSKLRDAGAIILGHSNMCEWASIRSIECSTGYSARGGQTRNPYDLRKSPHGSSSGSAVAVSANLVPLALGTETDTSIIGPASTNGVVGIKPTVGLTSRAGVIPISENMDSVGPFGKTIADAVLVLDVIVGEDPDDSFTMNPARDHDVPYTRYLTTSASLRGACFGLPVKRCWEAVPSSCKKVAIRVLDAIKGAGAEIYEVDFPSVEERVNEKGDWDWEHGEKEQSEWTVGKVDAYNNINSYLQGLVESPVRYVEDIIKFNEENTTTEGGIPGTLPAFPDGQLRFHDISQQKGVKDDTYYSALAHIQRQTREYGIDAALSYTDKSNGEKIHLDALLLCDRRGIGQQYAAQAGYPIICIPIGLDDDGLPVSLSLQQSAWKEAELVKWASAIEDLWAKETGKRVVPRFRNPLANNIPVESNIS